MSKVEIELTQNQKIAAEKAKKDAVMHRLYKKDGSEVNVNAKSLSAAAKLGWSKENKKAAK